MTDEARIKDLFLDALELEPADREVFLLDRCRDDRAVLEEVRALLAADGQAGRFLGASAHSLLQGRAESVNRPVPTVPEDWIDGRYELLELVGEGGFGQVYRCRQHQPLERIVALKLIKRGMDSDRVIRRFAAERQALARMDHPGIARVFDAGQARDGRPWFAMELVVGERIDAFCDGRRLDTRARLGLVEAVCRAVQHAHQKGVLHRDLKPSNVLVHLEEDGPRPKVIDFGIAKALGDDETRDPDAEHFTFTGELVGTPAYMSPEQARGSSDIDTRSDVYALGVLLYQLLTGTVPLHGTALQRRDHVSALQQLQTVDPQRPSARLHTSANASGHGATPPPGVRRQDVRSDLDWIVLKCLDRDRDRRYPTANALADDLARLLDGLPVEAGPPSPTYRLQKFARRHATALAVSAAFLVLLVAAAITSTVSALRARDAERTATGLREAAEQEARKYAQIADFTKSILTGIDPAVARGADTELLEATLARARRKLVEDPPDDAAVSAELHDTLGFALMQIGRYDAASEELAAALEASEAALGADHPGTLQSRRNLLIAWTQADRKADALQLGRQLSADARRVLGPDDPVTWAAESTVAVLLDRTGHSAEAVERLRALLARQEAVLPAGSDELTRTRNNLATMLTASATGDESVTLLEQALTANLASLGPTHPKTLATRNNLAQALGRQGRRREAAEMLREALDAKRTILPEEHPSLIIGLVNYAAALGQLDDRTEADVAEADRLFTRGCALALEHMGADHQYTLVGTVKRAVFLRSADRAADARDLLVAVLPGLRVELGPTHRGTLLAIRELADAQLDLGGYREAESTATAGLSACAEDSPEKAFRAGFLERRGRARLGLAEHAAGVADLEAAWAEFSDDSGEHLEARRRVAGRLATALETAGEPDAAALWRQRADR